MYSEWWPIQLMRIGVSYPPLSPTGRPSGSTWQIIWESISAITTLSSHSWTLTRYAYFFRLVEYIFYLRHIPQINIFHLIYWLFFILFIFDMYSQIQLLVISNHVDPQIGVHSKVRYSVDCIFLTCIYAFNSMYLVWIYLYIRKHAFSLLHIYEFGCMLINLYVWICILHKFE